MSKGVHRGSGPTSEANSTNPSKRDEGPYGLTRFELVVFAMAIARIWDEVFGPSTPPFDRDRHKGRT
jgi:hypothetical protein